MIIVLSPAKALDYESPISDEINKTQPLFMEEAAELINVLKKYTPAQIASLMSLSDTLSSLNAARYETWQNVEYKDLAKNAARQAIFAFNGDVYEGISANDLSNNSINWLQNHLCILSGLYGVLRPLDILQPYRLEMGTKLKTNRGDNLYQFWGDKITDYLNTRLIEDSVKSEKEPVLINLASQEYFKSVDKKKIKARIINCEFQDNKNGKYKIISFYAKRARGLMAKFAAENKIKNHEELKEFKKEGYTFDPAASSENNWIYRRNSP